MAFMKRTRRAPARPRKRARISRPSRISRIPRALANNHCMIKRTAQLSDFTVPGTFAWGTSTYTFKLSDLVNYTEFTALYNEYKISAVKVTFMPRFSGNDQYNAVQQSSSGFSAMGNPVIFTCTAEDGTVKLDSQSKAFQTSGARMVKNPWKPFSVYARAKWQGLVSTTLGATAANPRQGWLDCDNYGVVHYGVQVGGRTYSSYATAPEMKYDVFAVFYMQFRGAL